MTVENFFVGNLASALEQEAERRVGLGIAAPCVFSEAHARSGKRRRNQMIEQELPEGYEYAFIYQVAQYIQAVPTVRVYRAGRTSSQQSQVAAVYRSSDKQVSVD